MRKSLVKTCLLLCIVSIIGFGASCKKKCKTHNYVDGICSICKEKDENEKALIFPLETAPFWCRLFISGSYGCSDSGSAVLPPVPQGAPQ